MRVVEAATRRRHSGVDAGHQVIATDASPAMLALAQQTVPDARLLRQVVLPDDPMPAADAVVGVGSGLNYLPDEASIDRALVAIAEVLRPGGVLAIDVCDLEWGEARRDAPGAGRIGKGCGDRDRVLGAAARPLRAADGDVPGEPRRLVAT